MADVKWIKIVVDIFDDEKILLIESMPDADSILVIWFKILCLAGKINNGGVLMLNDRIPYTEEMLATIFRRPINTVRLALKTFEEFGMIEIIDNVVTIPNWRKHQNLDQLEERKEYMKKYMRQYREKQKKLASGEAKTCKNIGKSNSKVNSKANSKANVNSLEEDIEEDIDIDIYSSSHEIGKILSAFEQEFARPLSPMEIEQIRAWCEDGKLSSQLVLEALKRASLSGKASLSYIRGILSNWIKDGVRSVHEVQERDKYFKRRKNDEPQADDEKKKLYDALLQS